VFLNLSGVFVRGEKVLESVKGCRAWREAWCSSSRCSPWDSFSRSSGYADCSRDWKNSYPVVLTVKDRATIYIIWYQSARLITAEFVHFFCCNCWKEGRRVGKGLHLGTWRKQLGELSQLGELGRKAVSVSKSWRDRFRR